MLFVKFARDMMSGHNTEPLTSDDPSIAKGQRLYEFKENHPLRYRAKYVGRLVLISLVGLALFGGCYSHFNSQPTNAQQETSLTSEGIGGMMSRIEQNKIKIKNAKHGEIPLNRKGRAENNKINHQNRTNPQNPDMTN